MRPRQALGRPDTPVIPSAWSEAPRAVMAKTWTAECTIRHAGGTNGPFDTTTGTYPVTPHAPHFTGSARVQILNAQDQGRLVAEQQVTLTSYLIAVDLSCDAVAVGDVLTLTSVDEHGDPALVGRQLTVRSFGRGSLAWERDLIVTDDLG